MTTRPESTPASPIDGKGMFIVIEGIDGAGTTTQTRRLAERLRSMTSVPVEEHCEPTRSPLGQIARQMVQSGEHDWRTLATVFAADRMAHQKDLGFEDKIVVCDRYDISSLVYQGLMALDAIRTPVPASDLEAYQKAVHEVISAMASPIVPTVTFVLDVKPEEAMRRIEQRCVARDPVENLHFLSRARAEYLEIVRTLSDDRPIFKIGGGTEEEVTERMLEILQGNLLEHRRFGWVSLAQVLYGRVSRDAHGNSVALSVVDQEFLLSVRQYPFCKVSSSGHLLVHGISASGRIGLPSKVIRFTPERSGMSLEPQYRLDLPGVEPSADKE